MKIIKRTESPFRETPGGMLLVATSVAGQPPQFPPIEFVHNDQTVEAIELGPTGSLYSFTIVHPGKEKQPYGLAMVDFGPGVRAFGRLLLGARAPAIGSRLRVVPFALPDGTPDYAFQE
ncbi:putative OB-fold protein [Variovorax sp. TBS-050B]|uniref:Zn-ribbon domain-containing OB-fold protein n=1 Tax=Variovorax sp. TBS-050B TaxID=2940551 RepID=UPI0024768421|nr:OB-fold domain-containing protein [Variovorax sp. TBS-050B]MDH6590129.1 putative OB-fold protein [Variovorax sp. TBS-050B]